VQIVAGYGRVPAEQDDPCADRTVDELIGEEAW
jgi:hypothetical protein